MSLVADFGNVQVEYREFTIADVYAVVNLDYDQTWHNDDGTITRYKSRPSRDKKAIHVNGLPATARFIVTVMDAQLMLATCAIYDRGGC
jgi:hypothetical protein